MEKKEGHERETDLDYDFHEVFLGDNILTLDNLLKNCGEYVILIELQVNAFELGKANEICADQDTKILALGLTLLAVARVTLVLKAHPELVHFNEIGKLEAN